MHTKGEFVGSGMVGGKIDLDGNISQINISRKEMIEVPFEYDDDSLNEFVEDSNKDANLPTDSK